MSMLSYFDFPPLVEDLTSKSQPGITSHRTPCKILANMNRTSFSTPSSTSWITPFLLGASASLSIVWLSQKWKRSSTASFGVKVERKQSAHAKQSALAIGEDVLDHEQLSNRMLRKAEAVIQWRTSRLIIVIERCTNDHNYSAILRTAEALGIQTVYMIDPPAVSTEDGSEFGREGLQRQITRTPEEMEKRRLHHIFAQNATEWLTVRDFSTAEDCVAFCRKEGYKLWVTDLSQEAEALGIHSPDSIQIPDRIALVFGTEAVGASTYMLEQADKRVYLPLRGYADSLNLSVATALITQALFFMDPTLIGAMSEDERMSLRTSWYTKLAQQRILSSKQKKTRKKLIGQINKCETIHKRVKEDPSYHIQPPEKKKLNELSSKRRELEALDALIDPVKVQKAVQDWIDNPPDALTDLRRADTHRVCFVGKNTRDFHKEHWKDMVATSNKGTVEGISATAFREKMGIVAGTDSDV